MTESRQEPGTVKTASILIIGNEVLSGKVVDANSPFLLKELYALGVKVERVLTIPDVLEVIAQEVRGASERYDFVFTSGGVGPTHDDVTMMGIARAFDVPLEEHPDLLALLNAHYQGQLNEAARRMALLPEGAQLLYEGDIKYPMAVLRNVYIFPGVPELLRLKFIAIKERFRDTPYFLVQIYTRQGESNLAASLETTLSLFPGIEIGSYPRFDTHDYKVMLTLESKDRSLLCAARDHLLTVLEAEQLVRVVDG